MSIDKANYLNEIYNPLYERAKEICNELNKNGYIATYGWFNMHSVKRNDEFITEYFPIPVIKVLDVGDIGIDIDSIFIEVTISKENSLNFNYTDLASKYSFEVYGIEDYLNDLYNKDLDIINIKSRIEDSNEKQMHICVYLDRIASIKDILGAIEILSSKYILVK